MGEKQANAEGDLGLRCEYSDLKMEQIPGSQWDFTVGHPRPLLA